MLLFYEVGIKVLCKPLSLHSSYCTIFIFLGPSPPEIGTISSARKCLLNQWITTSHTCLNMVLRYKCKFNLKKYLHSECLFLLVKILLLWDSKVLGNSKLSLTRAVFYNQTTQKNVKRAAYQFQAQPNIYPPCVHFPYLNNGDSNTSLSHISAAHKN